MERVGPWALKGQLGSGGMGTVYLAERQDGTVAALKVIRGDYASAPEFRARFAREVAACARVRGRGVAEMVDADTEADSPWLALRYTPGPTLAHHVRSDGPLSSDGTRALAVGLADALAVIWSAGVVHRDLKPSNVILTPSGPVVIDFGVATAAEATSITATGAGVGSVGWMAPEQLQGVEISEAADVWGWGALVLYAATGAGPFGQGPAEALAWRTLHSEPTAESLTQVPEPLRGTVTRALAARPADRPVPAQLPSLAASDVASDPLAEAVTETDHDTLVMGLWDLKHIRAPPLPSTARPSPPPAVNRPTPPPAVAGRSRRSPRWLLPAIGVMLVVTTVIWTVIALTVISESDEDEPADVASVDSPSSSATQGQSENDIGGSGTAPPSGLPELDGMARSCAEGAMAACDDLLEAANDATTRYAGNPAAVDYLEFGDTCGGRQPFDTGRRCVDTFGPAAD